MAGKRSAIAARLVTILAGPPPAPDLSQSVIIDYTNYRGIRCERRISPRRIYFGTTTWHPEPQWLLEAYDHSRGADRSFALADLHAWRNS